MIEPAGALSAEPRLNGAEEYITVFAGRVEITVAEERFALEKGDSIRFSQTPRILTATPGRNARS